MTKEKKKRKEKREKKEGENKEDEGMKQTKKRRKTVVYRTGTNTVLLYITYSTIIYYY
jgi:hypothetical protein